MSNFYQILHLDLTHRMGWMLIHSLWQGALIAIALAVAKLSLREKSSQARYLAACLAMAGQVFLMVVTFVLLQGSYEPAPRSTSEPVFVQQINSLPPTAPASQSPPSLMPEGRELWNSFNLLEPLVPWTACVWSCGILILTMWNLGGSILLYRLKCLTPRSVDRFLESKLTQLLIRMQINQRVQVLQSSIAKSPMVIGIIKPVILFPTSLLTQLSPEQVETILIHELAHIRRHDFLVNLIQVATETLLFYHPATWWISAQIRAERENCCDDVVIQTSQKRDIYVTALAAIAELQITLAPAASGAPLLPRIQRLLSGTKTQRQPWSVPFSVFALLSLVFVVIICPTPRLNAQVAGNLAVKAPLATPSPVALDPKVHDALATTIAFYARKNSMEYDAVTRITTFNELKNVSFEVTSHATFQRPYSFTFDQPGVEGCRVISDGEKMVNYMPDKHRYTIEKPFDMRTLASQPDPMAIWASPIFLGTGIFFGNDFLTVCGGNLTSSQDLGLEQLNGLTARHLRLNTLGYIADLWFADGPAPLLLQTLLTIKGKNNKPPVVQKYLIVFSNWKFDQPIAPDTFVFHPPPEAQLVDELCPPPPTLTLGKPAPEFVAKSLTGENVSLASLRGKVVVLDFWSPQCGYSVKELPAFCQVIDSMRDKGVVFYSVDDWDNASKVAAFQKAKKLAFPVLLDLDVNIPGYPETVIVDKKGNIQVIEGYTPHFKEVLTQQLTDLLAGKDLNATKPK